LNLAVGEEIAPSTAWLAFGILLVAVIGLAAAIPLGYLLASRFNIKRIRLALRCEWRVLRDPAFAEKVEPLLAPKAENQAAGESARKA